MPYRSAAQRGFMHAQHPDIAARWDKEYGGKIVPKRKKKVHKALVLEDIEKGLGLVPAFQQKRKKNRDLRSQKTPYGFGEQHNTWVRKKSARGQERKEKRAQLRADYEEMMGVSDKYDKATRQAANRALRDTAIAPALAGIGIGTAAMPALTAGAYKASRGNPLITGGVALLSPTLGGAIGTAAAKPMQRSLLQRKVNRGKITPEQAQAVWDYSSTNAYTTTPKDYTRLLHNYYGAFGDRLPDEDLGKSLFGSHSARPGSHERKQHGKTALRVSPDERAALTVLGAGTAGVLGGALWAGGYKPSGRTMQIPQVLGGGTTKFTVQGALKHNWNDAKWALGRGLHPKGPGARFITQNIQHNPMGVAGTVMGVATAGLGLHTAVRAYGRRKEKDLPYKQAEKHLRRLDNIEGKSPELERAIRGMRENANKQTKMPRAALDELNQYGYKYGYAHSGRYDRAYGPFPMKEPGIQEAAWYRRKNDPTPRKYEEEVGKVYISPFAAHKIRGGFDKDTRKRAKKAKNRAASRGSTESYIASSVIAAGGRKAQKAVKPGLQTWGVAGAMQGVNYAGGRMAYKHGAKASLQNQINSGKITPEEAQGTMNMMTMSGRQKAKEMGEEHAWMPGPRRRGAHALYREHLEGYQKNDLGKTYDDMVNVAKRLREGN